MLTCARFNIRWIPIRFARVTTWVLGIVLPLSALANLASESVWERFLLAPIGLCLGVVCLAIARYSRAPSDDSAIPPPQSGVGTEASIGDRLHDLRPTGESTRLQHEPDLGSNAALGSASARPSSRGK